MLDAKKQKACLKKSQQCWDDFFTLSRDEYDYSVIIIRHQKDERDDKEYTFNQAKSKRWVRVQTRWAKTMDVEKAQKSPKPSVLKRAETVPVKSEPARNIDPVPQRDTDEDDTVEHFLDQILKGKAKLKSHGLPATVAERKPIVRTNPLSQAEILQQQIKNGVSLKPTKTIEKGLKPADFAATAPNTMASGGDTTLLKIFKNLANIPQDDDSDESVISQGNW